MGRTLLCIRGATQLRPRTCQPHLPGTTITGVYPRPITGATRRRYTGCRPVSLCGSEVHSTLSLRAGLSAQPNLLSGATLNAYSSSSLPCGFGDYTLHDPKLRLFTLLKVQFPGTDRQGRCGPGHYISKRIGMSILCLEL
jgi:hypothetical protein